MKSLDFNKGFINESQQINEFLGAAIVCGALGFMAVKGTLNIFAQIQKTRAEILQNKTARLQGKLEYNEKKAQLDKEKADKKWAKQNEKMMKKNLKMTWAWKNAIHAMPDGPEKDAEFARLDCQEKLLTGRATADDFKTLEKATKNKPKGVDQLEQKLNNTIDDSSMDKMFEEWLKKKGIDPDPEKLAATLGKSADVQMAAQSKEKSEDELKQEITDKLKDNEKDDIPEAIRGDDGKLDSEKLKALSGDDLKKVAETTGIKTTKEEPKQLTQGSTQGTQGSTQGAQGSTQGAQGSTQGAQGSTQGAQGSTQGAQGSTQGAQGTQEPEEFTDTDGNTYKKDENGKCTMTDSKGETIDIKPEEFENEKKANDENEDDVKDGDEPIDNDDDLDDEEFETGKDNKAKLSDKQDPRKIFKQRTYKRGNKTFRTKSYYSKHGVSISKDDFKERVAAWEKKNKKNPKIEKDNNSFTGTPWKMTRLVEAKSTPVNEATEVTDREGICKERLVYIKYVMDTTDNSVEKVKMERMYNALYNLTFDSNGELRSLGDLYTYLNETMVENKGEIPGLPTNDQIMNIDKKVKAFKDLEPQKYEAYLKRLEKENIDKSKTEKDDKAKDLLSKKQPKDDTDALSEIKKISTIPGLTNILGLEPDRKMSSEDSEKAAEVKKQQRDGSPTAKQPSEKDVNPEDISDEDIAKIVKGDAKNM